jgi:hypothetical protein
MHHNTNGESPCVANVKNCVRKTLESEPCSYELFSLESHILSFTKVLQIPPESPCIFYMMNTDRKALDECFSNNFFYLAGCAMFPHLPAPI